MQQKKIKLSIPEPCHEGWHNMTPTEQGRYCGSCQKEVIDFTGMTDAEIFAFFAQKNTGNVCGRTHISQLDTPIAKPIVHKKKRFWYLQYAAAFLLFLTRPGGAKAQVKPTVTVTPPTTQPTQIVLGNIAPRLPIIQEWLFKGKVQDEAGVPIPFASITIKGVRNGVTTDAAGNYQIKAKEGQVLQISSVGHETQEVKIINNLQSITTTLINNRSMLEGDVVVMVGAISSKNDTDYDDVAYDAPRYKTLLRVTDKDNGQPIAKAAISISRNQKSKQKQTHANSNGEYTLSKIKEGDTYTITISADGYQTTSININSYALNKGKNIQNIQLIKKMVPSEMIMGKMLPQPITTKTDKDITTQCSAIKPSQVQLGIDSNRITTIRLGGVTATHTQQQLNWQALAPVKKLLDSLATAFTALGESKKAMPVVPDALINIYPNPASSNGYITVSFSKVTRGSYSLQLYTIAGSLVQKQQITVPAEQFNFQWQLSNQVTAASYMLHVSDIAGKLIYNGKINVL